LSFLENVKKNIKYGKYYSKTLLFIKNFDILLRFGTNCQKLLNFENGFYKQLANFDSALHPYPQNLG
jgi:hypothetical protein